MQNLNIFSRSSQNTLEGRIWLAGSGYADGGYDADITKITITRLKILNICSDMVVTKKGNRNTNTDKLSFEEGKVQLLKITGKN